jgi:hypothetical protein
MPCLCPHCWPDSQPRHDTTPCPVSALALWDSCRARPVPCFFGPDSCWPTVPAIWPSITVDLLHQNGRSLLIYSLNWWSTKGAPPNPSLVESGRITHHATHYREKIRSVLLSHDQASCRSTTGCTWPRPRPLARTVPSLAAPEPIEGRRSSWIFFVFCPVWAKVGIELERNVELYQTL